MAPPSDLEQEFKLNLRVAKILALQLRFSRGNYHTYKIITPK